MEKRKGQRGRERETKKGRKSQAMRKNLLPLMQVSESEFSLNTVSKVSAELFSHCSWITY